MFSKQTSRIVGPLAYLVLVDVQAGRHSQGRAWGRPEVWNHQGHDTVRTGEVGKSSCSGLGCWWQAHRENAEKQWMQMTLTLFELRTETSVMHSVYKHTQTKGKKSKGLLEQEFVSLPSTVLFFLYFNYL